jgi:hypothetical protein
MATVLRPMNTSELLDRTFFLYRKHFVVFVGIAAIPNLAFLLFRLALIGTQYSAPVRATLATTLLLSLLSAAVYLVAVSAAQAATVVAVSDVHLERPASIGAAYARVKECLLQVLLAVILMGIGVTLGAILLILPGVLLALAWSLAIPVIVVEKQGPLEAIPRSSVLTKGSRSRIFVVLLLVIVFTYVIALIFQLPVLFMVGISRLLNPRAITPGISALLLIASFLSSSLVTPVSTIAISLIYYDQRVRKEGFDMQLMMASLKSLPQNPPVAPAS